MVLDHLRQVAEQQQHALEPLLAQHLDDVLEERPAVELDHRLGPGVGERAHARASAAGQDHGLPRALGRAHALRCPVVPGAAGSARSCIRQVVRMSQRTLWPDSTRPYWPWLGGEPEVLVDEVLERPAVEAEQRRS